MEKYNPVNLETKADGSLEQIIAQLEKDPSGYSVLLVSETWFDDIEDEENEDEDSGEWKDPQEEYVECFEKISEDITKLTYEQPVTLTWEENEDEMNALADEGDYCWMAKYWPNKQYVLYIEHEDKELPISIVLIKREL